MILPTRILLYAIPRVVRGTAWAQRATGLTSAQLALVLLVGLLHLPTFLLFHAIFPWVGPICGLAVQAVLIALFPRAVRVRLWRAWRDPEGIPTTRAWADHCLRTAYGDVYTLPVTTALLLVSLLAVSGWGYAALLYALLGNALDFLVPLVAAVPTIPSEDRVFDCAGDGVPQGG